MNSNTAHSFKERVQERNESLINTGSFTEKMSAIGDSLLRKWIITDIADLTDSSIWTVAYSWANGTNIPPMCKQRIIAQYFDETIENLFPKN